MNSKVQPETPSTRKVPKKLYSKNNITNLADNRIRKELDDADSVLEKVIYTYTLNC